MHHNAMYMFQTDSQLCWLHNGMSGCQTQILVAIPIHNRTPSRYATGQIILTGYATVPSRYAAGRTVLLLNRTEEIAQKVDKLLR